MARLFGRRWLGTSNGEGGEQSKRSDDWVGTPGKYLWPIVVVALLGLVLVGAYAVEAEIPWVHGAMVGAMVALASFFVGGIGGFLFGIPKANLADDMGAERDRDASGVPGRTRPYRANTNLEDISDWLTKVLVGLGLAQLNEATDFIDSLGDRVGSAMGGASGADEFAIAILLGYTLMGFLFFYIWTRIYLPSLLALSETVESSTKEAGVLAQRAQSQRWLSADERNESRVTDILDLLDTSQAIGDAAWDSAAFSFKDWIRYTSSPPQIGARIEAFDELLAMDANDDKATVRGSRLYKRVKAEAQDRARAVDAAQQDLKAARSDQN